MTCLHCTFIIVQNYKKQQHTDLKRSRNAVKIVQNCVVDSSPVYKHGNRKQEKYTPNAFNKSHKDRANTVQLEVQPAHIINVDKSPLGDGGWEKNRRTQQFGQHTLSNLKRVLESSSLLGPIS